MSIQYKNSDILSVPNVASLFTLKNLVDNQLVQTQGYSVEGVGGNLYRYDAGSASSVDYGHILDGIGGNGTGTGTGRFIAVDQSSFKVSHFGCVDTPGVDNATNFQRCIDAAEAEVVASGGSWGTWIDLDLKYMRCNSGVTIEQNTIKLRGHGTYSTSLAYGGTTGTFITFTKGATGMVHVGISDVSITCTDTSNTKTAIKFDGCQESHIRDVIITNWSGVDSVGIQISGHQTIDVKRVNIYATVPIRISESPIAGGVDFDHCHFSDMYLVRSGAAPSTLADALFLIDATVYVSNMTIDGYNAFVGGKEGVYFQISGSPVATSHGISISNIRAEQHTASGGFAVNIAGDASHYIHDVTLNNIRSATGVLRARYYYVASCSQITSTASGALDVDVVGNLILDGYYLSHATAMTMGSMKMVSGSTINSGLGGYLNFARSTWTYPNAVTAKGLYTVLQDGIYTDTDTTPSVKYTNMLVCNNSGPTSITDFDDAVDNQVIVVKCNANTTIVHNASLIQLAGGANFVGSGTITLYSYAGVWYESSRSNY